MTNPVSEDDADVIRIDIVSDVVCPWCIIGFKQLEKAVALTRVPAEVYWHPFELNPGMSEDGENLREHVAAKYGTTPEGSRKARARLTDTGAELGFPFRYTDDMRMVNTFRAHQLLYWADTQARAHNLKMALFSAFFTHGRDVNDPEVLAEVAGEIGLNRKEALAVLEDARYADAVRKEEGFWTSRGIHGVPAMIFNQRHVVSGAQGVENYTTILMQLAANAAA